MAGSDVLLVKKVQGSGKDMTNEQMVSCYDEFFEMVWRVCYVELSGRQQDVEDAVSDTFLKLLKSCNIESSEREHIKAWLIVTAQNTCRSLTRRAYRKVVSLEDYISVNGEPEDSQILSSELSQALDGLSDNERDAVVLHYYFGYSGAEIADLKNVAENTVYSWLSRARKRLEKLLEGGD